MRTYTVGVLGATGMVGQRFVTLLKGHPWFRLGALAASARSKGKAYDEAVRGRWAMPEDIPQDACRLVLLDAEADAEQMAAQVDFVFCAVDMPKEEIRRLETRYAALECPVISNNSAHRWTPDVPMVIPEVNPHHTEVIETQRKRLGVRRGFVAVKSNCSIQSYVAPLHTLHDRGLQSALVCTFQAVSGAGKTLEAWPEMRDNVIPFISGEEEKSEQEPLKIWGHVQRGQIVCADTPRLTAQCLRAPVSDGHMAAVFARLERPLAVDEIKHRMAQFTGLPQKLALPSAPERPIHVFEQPDRPQTALDRDLEAGMAVSVGRLRPDTQYDFKFVCLSHNTLRGAAGGAVLLAELLCAQGFIPGA